MDFSDAYYARKQKMQNLEVPTMTEIRSQLGEELSAVLFETCPESLRDEMSISSKLHGPGEELWISPSDLLIGKVCLKPPLTHKHIKALTHEGILDIGRDIEVKLLEHMRLEKLRALQEQENLLLFMAEREKNRAVAEAKERAEEMFRLKLMQLNEEFECLLQEELNRLEEHLKEMYEKLIEEKMAELLNEQEDYWAERMEAAVAEAVANLTKKFLADMVFQEQELTEMFNMKLEGQEEKYQEIIANQQDVFTKVLKQLKHNLQCNNIANLMYVLCMERRKCLQEQQSIVDSFADDMAALVSSNHGKDDKIEKLTAERDEKQRQCNIREECLLGVISQFQKFINFVLCATPTQAEFLLSVEKMMMFELTQAVARTANKEKQRHVKQLMPWRTESKISVARNKNGNILKINDFHNCLNELPIPKGPADSETDLFAVTLNEHLYVREDFRNKISQGFTVRPSNLIWNQDVENLINLLKEQAEMNKPEEQIADEVTSIAKQRSHFSRRSSVHFIQDSMMNSIIMDNQESVNVGLLAVQDSVILQKSIKSRVSNQEEIAKIENLDIVSEPRDSTGVALLATQDSLTMAKNLGKTFSKLNKPRTYLPELSDSKSESVEKIMTTISNDTLQLTKSRQKIEVIETEKYVIDGSTKRNISDETLKLTNGRKMPGSRPTSNADFQSRAHSQQSLISQSKAKSRDVKKNRAKVNRSQQISKLTLHRDSVELIRQSISREPSKLKEIIEVCHAPDKAHPTTQFVINIPSEYKLGEVNFSKVATVFRDLQEHDKPWKIYEKPQTPPKEPSRDNFLDKPNEAKILGQQKEENVQSRKDFTIHRLHSLVDLLKKDQSLIRMFTSCNQ